MSQTSSSPHLINKDQLIENGTYAPQGAYYINFFRFIAEQLRPDSYFEIGTERGRSAAAFQCEAVCVDPKFKLDTNLLDNRTAIHLFQMTSDEFFLRHDLKKLFPSGPRVCFLDGMHRFEYLLRDFMNVERLCNETSLILLHDCIPAFPRMTLRTHVKGKQEEGRFQGAWTGDVWKVVPILTKLRPDLRIKFVDCSPTGLVAVSKLNPHSVVLAKSYVDAVDEMRDVNIETFGLNNLLDLAPIISSKSLMLSPEDVSLYFNIW